MKSSSWIVIVALAATLSGCGGGGEGTTANAGAAAAAPPAAAPPPVAPSSIDFTTFVESQWKVAPMGSPTSTQGVAFSFADNSDPTAFNTWLMTVGN